MHIIEIDVFLRLKEQFERGLHRPLTSEEEAFIEWMAEKHAAEKE